MPESDNRKPVRQTEWDVDVRETDRGNVVMFDFAGPSFNVDKAVEIRGYRSLGDGDAIRLLTSHDGPIIADESPETHLRVPLDHSVLRLDVPDQCYGELLSAVEENLEADH